MRYPIVAMLGLALVACSNQPKANANELEDFIPPTVRVRGDVVPGAQARFAKLDRNNDGFLVAAEFPRNGAQRVERLDSNKDGKVSRSEFVEAAIRRFDRFDTDKDGQVTPQERDAARTTAG